VQRRAAAVVGALLSKVTRGSDVLPDPRAFVLEAGDLPAGYELVQLHVSRAGLADRGSGWADRVREARGRSARAAFKRGDDPLAFVASQALPLLSEADAAEAFATVGQRMLTNPDAGVSEVGREPLTLAEPIGEAYQAFRIESRNARFPGIEGEQLGLAWRQGRVVAFLTLAGTAGSWSTDDLERLARVQAARIAAIPTADTAS
jgi:hypothetical protein